MQAPEEWGDLTITLGMQIRNALWNLAKIFFNDFDMLLRTANEREFSWSQFGHKI
jgi:hypothetical protein